MKLLVSRYVRYKLTLKKSAGGCDGCAKSVAERSHPTSEARGRSREDPMPKGRRPRGVTERPRSGAEAGRTPCPKGGGQEALPHVRGQGQWPRAPGCEGAGTAERSYPASEVRGSDERSYPVSEVRGRGREDQPHGPRSRGCAGAGGPRGAIPR